MPRRERRIIEAVDRAEVVRSNALCDSDADDEAGEDVLNGARTVLRPMRPVDADRQYLFDQDMELSVLDCRPPVPTSREKTEEFVRQQHEDQRDVVRMAIEADQQYIGHCSLSGLRDPHGSLELGVVIGDREYWSKGYGREVVGLLLAHGFQTLGARRIALTTHEDNPRAIRCYAGCGFIEEGRPRQAFWTGRRYADLVEMSILRAEWMAARSSSDVRDG